MEINCSEKELLILNNIGAAAQKLGMEAYLIGGFVRDKIIGRETKDADIVCLGDGIALATEAATSFSPIPQVNYFKNFGILIGAGPSVSLAVYGTQDFETVYNGTPIDFGWEIEFGPEPGDFKRVDFAMDFSAGVKWKRIRFDLVYNLGLINIESSGDYKNRYYGVQLSYWILKDPDRTSKIPE